MYSVRRTVVWALASLDAGIDALAYRPAVVKAFAWLPRWWQCGLAKLSIRLDDRWHTGWWGDVGLFPGVPCEACRRRASVLVYGADDDPDVRPVRLCGWCRLTRPIVDEHDRERALAEAAAESVAWRWRRPD